MFAVPAHVAALVIRHVKLSFDNVENFLVSMLVQHDQFDETRPATEFLLYWGLGGFDLRTWLFRFFGLCSWDIGDAQ